MGAPDVIEFGQTRPRRRPWGWLIVALVSLSIGVTAAVARQAHQSAEAQADASVPARPPLLGIFGFGYETYGDQLSFSLDLRNLSRDRTTLSQPAVLPAPGASIISIGFRQDQGSTSSPTITLPAAGTGQVVVEYTVDCSIVRSPWPYLEDVTVRWTRGSSSSSTQLSPTVNPADRPSPPPCPTPGH